MESGGGVMERGDQRGRSDEQRGRVGVDQWGRSDGGGREVWKGEGGGEGERRRGL